MLPELSSEDVAKLLQKIGIHFNGEGDHMGNGRTGSRIVYNLLCGMFCGGITYGAEGNRLGLG